MPRDNATEMESIAADEATLKDRLVVLTKQLAETEGLKKSANKKFNDDIADIKFEIKETMDLLRQLEEGGDE
jgi:hypothetical protein